MSRRELAARKGSRASTTLPPPAAVARESRGGPRRRRLTSLQSRLGVPWEAGAGVSRRAARRAAEAPQAGSALGDARHDGAADMAPLKPRTRAPRAGRALSEPGEVTWLHTFDCFWSPSPEGGAGQVRSRVRVTRLRGLAPGTWRVWGRGPGGGAKQPARGRWRGACSSSSSSSSAASTFLTLRPGQTRSCGLAGVSQLFSGGKARCPNLGVSECRWVRVASSNGLRFGGAGRG